MPAQDAGDQHMADGYRPSETGAERDDRNLADLPHHLRGSGRHVNRRLVGAPKRTAGRGLAAVAWTVSPAVLLGASYVARGAPAVIIGVFAVGLFAGLWFVYPLPRPWDSQPEPPEP